MLRWYACSQPVPLACSSGWRSWRQRNLRFATGVGPCPPAYAAGRRAALPYCLTTTDPAAGPLSKSILRSPADAAGITVDYSGAAVTRIVYSANAVGLVGGQRDRTTCSLPVLPLSTSST